MVSMTFHPFCCLRAWSSRVLLLWVLLLSGLAPAGDVPSELARGRELTRQFLADELSAVWGAFTPEMHRAFGGMDGLRGFRRQVRAQLGEEAEVLSERIDTVPGFRVYNRVARFRGSSAAVRVQWTLDRNGRAAGFFVASARVAATDHLDYPTRTALRLPFDGAWFVYWGGREVDRNYHAIARDQRFAYDFLVVEQDRTHTGGGGRNEDYHCYGRPVLAPGAGRVHAAEDGHADNPPGNRDHTRPFGNHVIIDHGNGEYSFLAHLRRGSVAVAIGQRVEAGDRVGACGNSGNSSEPHLHYHLQDSPERFHGGGLPAQFRGYLADGRPVDRGEPARGETVRRADMPWQDGSREPVTSNYSK